MIYFNEINPFAADWLKALYPQAHIDRRSITDVAPADVIRFTRAHFFGGIGGWQYALQLAGWTEDRPCWTGSCPCPPFSCAGKKQRCPACGGRPIPCPRRTGYFICLSCEHAWHADGRHLWPEFWRLIRDCRPPVVFGEQVGGPDGLLWLAGVRGSLDRIDYDFGAANLPACSIEAPHKRERLFWVAVARESKRGWRTEPGRQHGEAVHVADGGDFVGLADAEHKRAGAGWAGVEGRAGSGRDRPAIDGLAGVGLGQPDGDGPRGERLAIGRAPEAAGAGPLGGVGESIVDGRQPRIASAATDGHRGSAGSTGRDGHAVALGDGLVSRLERQPRHGDDGDQPGRDGAVASGYIAAAGAVGPWSRYEIIHFQDGKTRRIEPGLEPLVDGVSFRLADGRTRNDTSRREILKGIGNAIVPELAAKFIMAFLESETA